MYYPSRVQSFPRFHAHPDQRIVQEALRKNGRDRLLRRAIEDAWSDLKSKQPGRALWRRKSTTAGLMWEYAVQRMVEAFADDPGVKPIPHLDTVSFILDDIVLIRVKKADLELRSRNYPTALALLFHEHEEDLFGFEGLHRVEAAYVPNRFETEINWIGIVARDGSKSLWHFELEAGGAVVVPFPVEPATVPASETVMRRKQTESDKKDEQEEEK